MVHLLEKLQAEYSRTSFLTWAGTWFLQTQLLSCRSWDLQFSMDKNQEFLSLCGILTQLVALRRFSLTTPSLRDGLIGGVSRPKLGLIA
jgi:hypothetical protein